MRYLGLLTLTFSLATPALARKTHHPKHARPVHQARHVAPLLPAAEPTRVARAEPPRPVSAAVQENDDEVPGARKKK